MPSVIVCEPVDDVISEAFCRERLIGSMSTNHMISQLAPLLYIPAGAAILGWLLGRLIRGRRPKAEAERPRLAVSSAYFRDACNRTLSAPTRTRCGFDAAYLSLLELAESSGQNSGNMDHPNLGLIRNSMQDINATVADVEAMELLAIWVTKATPALPGISADNVCALAARIREKTLDLVSKKRGLNDAG